MVTWQEFVSLAFEVKRDRGNEVDSLDESQRVLSIAAGLWNDKKSALENADRAAAKRYIEDNA